MDCRQGSACSAIRLSGESGWPVGVKTGLPSTVRIASPTTAFPYTYPSRKGSGGAAKAASRPPPIERPTTEDRLIRPATATLSTSQERDVARRAKAHRKPATPDKARPARKLPNRRKVSTERKAGWSTSSGWRPPRAGRKPICRPAPRSAAPVPAPTGWAPQPVQPSHA